ncbi:MAG: DUF6249 domain-containing protein [Bacteroides sp.]|nr:DUF6249 domain-containing protein [Bacteroides sp.]MDD7490546.1 DUF6249 domain-containing protein [Bacteroides sp.]MDY5891705.1 DUF6249 domain-containing protein [Candidatus Cryptobacteroides sp.]
MQEIIISTLVPISICVVLPCIIVFLVTRSRSHMIDKKTEVVLKAIESGAQLDPNIFGKERTKSTKQKVFAFCSSGMIVLAIGVALLVIPFWAESAISKVNAVLFQVPGCILGFLGIALLCAYFIMKKQFSKEIEEEERQLSEQNQKAHEDA